ncbi:hypothetical protein EZ428_02715 [Pedobacter frigiditerrae]|uniref:SMODS-associating 2TM beta-strand rich effector domain-containing protein n=1 Tax=Pedobacter frigiditerrae TaxID=2530452 RepID=A0A4R0N1T8_9SPHI|nr:hypothetical protein [Pedobacter frigiditerrae]TCC93700.1 hypothetical protein EZ428_02715 [Pedobacter frigiditerrae]
MKQNPKDINKFILFVVIGVFVFTQSYLKPLAGNIYLLFIVSYLGSLGFYHVFVIVLYWLVNNVSFLLKIYYNRTFLKGIWSYKYTLNNKVYFGIWNINQDLNGILINGYGINIDGKPRSDVRSVSQLIYNKGAFDIVNSREDLIEPEKENFSKTTLHPIAKNSNGLSIPYPTSMRARTYIYGGRLSGTIHVDVLFEKHEDIKSEDDVRIKLIDEIKQNYNPSMYEY